MNTQPVSQPFNPEWNYPSITYHHYVGHHSMYLIIAGDLKTKRIKYIEMRGAKPDPCEVGYREAICRLANIAFSKGATVKEVSNSIGGIRCVPESNNEIGGYIHSPADYLSKCLRWFDAALNDPTSTAGARLVAIQTFIEVRRKNLDQQR